MSVARRCPMLVERDDERAVVAELAGYVALGQLRRPVRPDTYETLLGHLRVRRIGIRRNLAADVAERPGSH
jgi:hypothetical protein